MVFLLLGKRINLSIPCSCLRLPPSCTPLFFSSSHSLPPNNVISELLVKECGFCSSEVTRVMTKAPTLLRTKFNHTARHAIQLLRDSGFIENQLHKIIVRNPRILTLKVDGQLRLKMEFLNTIGFSPQDLTYVISNTPRLLTANLENSLRPKVLYLENLFGSKFHLCHALRVAPQLLPIDIDKQLKPKVEFVKNNMGILEGSKTFVYALGAVVSCGVENVEKKMKYMVSLGFLEEEIQQILKKCPCILHLSTHEMQKKMDFLINMAVLSHKTIVSNPMLMHFSIEKRLKPRYAVFKSLSVNPHSKSLPRMFMITEQKFLQKFGMSYARKGY